MFVEKLKLRDEFTDKYGKRCIVCRVTEEEEAKLRVLLVYSPKALEGWLRYDCGGSLIFFEKRPEGIYLEGCSDFKPYVKE